MKTLTRILELVYREWTSQAYEDTSTPNMYPLYGSMKLYSEIRTKPKPLKRQQKVANHF